MTTPRNAPVAHATSTQTSVGTGHGRRATAQRLARAYPDLPVHHIVSAVAEIDRAMLLCGDGAAELAVMERSAHRNLQTVTEHLAARAAR